MQVPPDGVPMQAVVRMARSVLLGNGGRLLHGRAVQLSTGVSHDPEVQVKTAPGVDEL